MRRFNIFLALVLLFTSCVEEDQFYVEKNTIDSDSGIKILGFVQDFDAKKVTTRSGESDMPSDSYISEMTMFVFDKNGKLLQGYTNREVVSLDDKGYPSKVNFYNEHKCSSAINIRKANPTFLIDTKEGLIASLDDASPRVIYYDNLTNNDNDLSACKIYIVANAWHKLEGELSNITKLEELEAITLDIDNTLSMPMGENNHYRGFPMIGTHLNQTFDLSNKGNNAGSVAKIPLKKLYAKINFSIQVNANQVVSTPRFRIEKVEVFNVPKKAKLGRKLNESGKPDYEGEQDYIVEMVGNNGYTPSDYYQFIENKPFVIEEFSRKEISHTTSKVLSPGSEYLIEFGFYMPEHKVTPNANRNNYDYPDGIDEDLKQYYKPMLVGAVRNEDGTTTNGKNATFVRIHGNYTDHNAQIKNVRYDIYLGQDNTDDFTVKRNQLLNNKLVITGLTNYHDAYDGVVDDNISIDHRVDVDYMGFNLSMEREAILDAHFEVRPLDIELSPGGSMTITIPEQYRDWVAMESDATARGGDNNVYVNTNTPRKGVRKYFTTNLVSELTTANKGTLTVSHSNETNDTEIHRVWFYIDENPNVYDKLWKEGTISYTGAVNDVVTIDKGNANEYTINKTQYRNCPVEFRFVGTDNDNTDGTATVTKKVTVNFQQWNLWRVWNQNKTRFYDIEHEEEYLNNYASDQQYGQTQDGMPWGLNNIDFSYEFQSLYAVQSGGSGLGGLIDAIGSLLGAKTAEEFANATLGEKGVSPKYDFYLSRDIATMPTEHQSKFSYFDNSGLRFNKRIAAYLKTEYASHQQGVNNDATIDKLILTEAPKSALAYALNKNKRTSEGIIDTVNIKWYLPAIDEIENIAKGAYDEFDRVFQNNLYWSSQPAFTKNQLNVTKIGNWLADYGKLTGTYYEEDNLRARSTFVYTDDGGSNWEPCNSDAPAITTTISGEIEYYKISSSIDFDGLQQKTNTVTDFSTTPGNKARTDKCRIRAVYRSGTK